MQTSLSTNSQLRIMAFKQQANFSKYVISTSCYWRSVSKRPSSWIAALFAPTCEKAGGCGWHMIWALQMEQKNIRPIGIIIEEWKFLPMGNITANSADPSDEQTHQLNLNIDLKRPVQQELRQLLNWSLGEIREIYAPFRRRKGSPILTRSEFLRFIQLSRITSFYIYDTLIRTDIINAFEIVSVLVLTAYTSYTYKVHFLFNIFDLECRKKLAFEELILMFKSIVRGFCFVTAQPLPDDALLVQYGKVMLSRADLNNDQHLELGEIQGWLENSKENLAIFEVFEPETPIKEDYFIFNPFTPYTPNEVRIMRERLLKIDKKQKMDEEDYLMLKPIFKKRVSPDPKKKEGLPRIHRGKQMEDNRGKLMGESRGKPMGESQVRKKFKNIIIIKGRTITKKQVFELREYFGNMSGGKEFIRIEDFIENFNQEKYNHMKSVAASLFNFLDKKQHGQIEFMDLVTKLYPNLSPKEHLPTIEFWSDEYNRNFNINKKVKANRDEEVKKRILPKSCVPRLKELFAFFSSDKQNKYVSLEDLRRVLGRACTDKEINYLFESSDQDKDGKLTIKEFVHVLLPPDLQIEELM